MHVGSGTAPEEAIKTAYDFAKVLRDSGFGEDDFDRQRAIWVEHRYGTNPLLPYIRAGFEAGFFARPLPWVRQVDAAGRSSPAASPPPQSAGSGEESSLNNDV